MAKKKKDMLADRVLKKGMADLSARYRKPYPSRPLERLTFRELADVASGATALTGHRGALGRSMLRVRRACFQRQVTKTEANDLIWSLIFTALRQPHPPQDALRKRIAQAAQGTLLKSADMADLALDVLAYIATRSDNADILKHMQRRIDALHAYMAE